MAKKLERFATYDDDTHTQHSVLLLLYLMPHTPTNIKYTTIRNVHRIALNVFVHFSKMSKAASVDGGNFVKTKNKRTKGKIGVNLYYIDVCVFVYGEKVSFVFLPPFLLCEREQTHTAIHLNDLQFLVLVLFSTLFIP